MGPLDRVILVIYAFTVTVALGLAAVALTGYHLPSGIVAADYTAGARRDILLVIIGVYILMGARLFWAGLIKSRSHQAVVREGALGQVRIALHAIESLVEKIIDGFSGVREVKARVVVVPRGVGIKIKISVSPDTNIPVISKEIQEQVKEQILEVTGVEVHDVLILVDKIAANKPRVE
ncbi:MAG: alkaline shock response membrane anchor protein AmaP [Bacillota bacterium]